MKRDEALARYEAMDQSYIAVEPIHGDRECPTTAASINAAEAFLVHLFVHSVDDGRPMPFAILGGFATFKAALEFAEQEALRRGLPPALLWLHDTAA